MQSELAAPFAPPKQPQIGAYFIQVADRKSLLPQRNNSPAIERTAGLGVIFTCFLVTFFLTGKTEN